MNPDRNAESVRHDWKAEASGLAYMICEIADQYRYAKAHLGGDSEFLANRIFAYERYVNGPMWALFEAERNDGPEGGLND